MSQTGSMLVTSSSLEEGERVRLFLRIPPDSEEEQEIAARVTRTEPNSADPEGLWPYRVAVEFDQPYPELEDLLLRNTEYIEGLAESGQQGEDAPPDDE